MHGTCCDQEAAWACAVKIRKVRGQRVVQPARNASQCRLVRDACTPAQECPGKLAPMYWHCIWNVHLFEPAFSSARTRCRS
ncbi:hypothetical protein VTO73DRAFT_11376 [Trametes versicolor]